MTDSMIERVARAICLADGLDPDSDWTKFRPQGPEFPPELKSMWTCYEEKARAAIEAMREPTDYMKAAWSLEVRDPAWCLHDWQSAIDAALNEKAGA